RCARCRLTVCETARPNPACPRLENFDAHAAPLRIRRLGSVAHHRLRPGRSHPRHRLQFDRSHCRLPRSREQPTVKPMDEGQPTVVPEHSVRVQELTTRIRRTNSVYARFYGPLCLLVITASFFPYYSPADESTAMYGNLWHEVFVTGRGFDVFALFVLLFTAGLLCLSTVSLTSVTGLIPIVTGSVIIGCTLLQSPGYVSPPALTDFGVFDIVLSFLIAAAALGHSLHLVAPALEFQRRMV